MPNKTVPGTVESFAAFEAQVADLKSYLKSKRTNGSFQSEPLFRGQSNSDWGLDTTLERFMPSENVKVRTYNRYLARARPTIETLTGRMWPFTHEFDLSKDWFPAPPNYEFMVYVRHHGYPSPLLDWSRSPYVALYFAFCAARIDQDVAVFSFVSAPTGTRDDVAKAPTITQLGPFTTTHPRHFAQQSRYTICTRKPEKTGWEYCSHDLVVQNETGFQDLLRKIVLPGSLRLEVLDRLDHMNINGYTLFNTEDGLMSALAFRDIEAYEARQCGKI